MNGSRSFALAAVLLSAIAGCAQPGGFDDAPTTVPPTTAEREHPISNAQIRALMEQKLAHAHALLDAIVLEDFRRIEHHARQLTSLSSQSEWYVHETERYVELSREFQQITERLARYAQEEDAAAVSREHVQMTSSCTKCHNYLRREGLVKDLPGVISRAPPRTDKILGPGEHSETGWNPHSVVVRTE